MVTSTPTVDIKSRLGYLSEYITANELSELIIKYGHNNQFQNIQELYQTKLAEVILLNPNKKELDRISKAGIKLANHIFDDFQDKTSPFTIRLTGDSEKGKSKSDILIYNNYQSIDASLKVYKTTRINVLGTTFVSILKKLFHSPNELLPKSTEEYINYFRQKFDNIKYHRLLELYNYQQMVRLQLDNGISKTTARNHFKANHNNIMIVFKDIVEHYYETDKQNINKRLLQILGLESSESIYACIGSIGKQKVFSSRSNLLFQDKLTKLNRLEFDIKIEPYLKGGFLRLIDYEQKELLNLRISISDTGTGSGAQGKFTYWLDFKQFMETI